MQAELDAAMTGKGRSVCVLPALSVPQLPPRPVLPAIATRERGPPRRLPSFLAVDVANAVKVLGSSAGSDEAIIRCNYVALSTPLLLLQAFLLPERTIQPQQWI